MPRLDPDADPEDAARQLAALRSFYAAAPEPIRTVALSILASGALGGLSVSTSLFNLFITTAPRHSDLDAHPVVGVEYASDRETGVPSRPFRLSLRRVNGVPYDEKWCDADEAAATILYHARRLPRSGSG